MQLLLGAVGPKHLGIEEGLGVLYGSDYEGINRGGHTGEDLGPVFHGPGAQAMKAFLRNPTKISNTVIQPSYPHKNLIISIICIELSIYALQHLSINVSRIFN